MKGPILGFRGWQVTRPTRHAVPDPDRTVFVPTRRPSLGHLAADPEVEAWLKEHARRERPARRFVTDEPDWEPGTLMPLSRPGATWVEPGPVQFLCSFGHLRPERRCHCGLYAWLSLGQLDHRLAKQDIAGAVIAWGHIVVHGVEGRSRAEWMRIVALSPAPPHGTRRASEGKWARVAAERYGVPCVPLDRLEQVGREFGTPIRWEYRFE